jgi:hypothetical protein
MLLHPDFVLANVVALPGGMVLVDWAGARRGPHRRRSSLRVGQVAGSVIGRLRSPRHPSPDFSYLLAYLVVDSGLVVDSVRRDAPDTPQNPDPPHQGSLHATTVVPADPPDSTVSPQGRFSWRIGACGRIWGTIVHKVLPQAQMLHNLGARWTERPLSAASWPQRPAGGRGGHFGLGMLHGNAPDRPRSPELHNEPEHCSFSAAGVAPVTIVLSRWFVLRDRRSARTRARRTRRSNAEMSRAIACGIPGVWAGRA